MKKKAGYLEVIAGPMFSGKTEELIRQLKRASIGKKKVQVFKHEIDTRYGLEKKLYSHGGFTFESFVIGSAKDIPKLLDESAEIIAIDEAQWLGEALVPVITNLVEQGKKVLVSGLAMTYDRQPFIPIPELMAIADKVTKLTAVCSKCGDEAVFHKRIVSEKRKNPFEADPKLVGKSLDEYQPRCRKCFPKN